MNRKHFINICLVALVLILFALVGMPRKLAVLRNVAGHYYDDRMRSQEFMVRKEQDKYSKNNNIPEKVKLDSIEILAKNLWASFRRPEAKRLLLEVKNRREKMEKQYNQKLINTMLTLAGVCRDINDLSEAEKYYEQIQKLDKKNLPANDSRLVRDQINLAMMAYLQGDMENDQIKRKHYFESCLDHINQSQKIWHIEKNPNRATLSNIIYLKHLVCRELGDQNASKQAYGEAKYLTKQFKRPYVLPQT